MRASLVLACSLVLLGHVFGEEDLRYKDQVFKKVTRGDKVFEEAQTVEITEETWNKVIFKIGLNATSDLPRADVSRIKYDQGEELEKAKRALSGDPNEAIKLFKEVLNRSQRKIFEQHALRGLGVACMNAGDYKDAAAAFNDLITKFPNGMYVCEAAENAVRCFLETGNANGAAAALNAITATVNDDGRFEETKQYLNARIDEVKRDYQKSEAAYAKVGREAGKFPDLRDKARVGAGRCMVLLQDFQNADSTFRQVIDGGAQGLQLYAAWNGLGEVSLAKAEAERNIAARTPLYHAALMCYLRAAIMFVPESSESPEEKAKGLARAAYCFSQLADSQDSTEAKARYHDRAMGLKGEAMQIGGGWGDWAQKHVR